MLICQREPPKQRLVHPKWKSIDSQNRCSWSKGRMMSTKAGVMVSSRTRRTKYPVSKDLLTMQNQAFIVKAGDWLLCLESPKVEAGITLLSTISPAESNL